MAIERAPRNPLPRDYAPSQVWYKVTDKDDWRTVAKKFEFDVQTLIFFNFHTHNTDEVNWYLRRNVGCKVSRDGGRNWAFSDSAYPGKIYIPASKADFSAEEASDEPSGRNKLAQLLDDMPEDSEGWEHVGRTLELFEFAHVGAEAFGLGVATEEVAGGEAAGEAALAGAGSETVVASGVTGVASLGATVVAPLAGAAALAIAIGSPYKAQVDTYKKRAWLWGLGLGIVLGANQNVHPGWVIAHFGTGKTFPGYIKALINIPGQEDKFGEVLQSFYDGIKKGWAYGRQLNSREASRLYKVLGQDVNPSVIDHVGSAKYYYEYGSAFRIKFLPAA